MKYLPALIGLPGGFLLGQFLKPYLFGMEPDWSTAYHMTAGAFAMLPTLLLTGALSK